MSYGFYKLAPGATRDQYIAAVDQDKTIHGGTVTGVVTSDQLTSSESEKPKPGIVIAQAIAQGYSGNICTTCQGARLKWAGHCQVCEDCGTTTGCS